MSRQNKAKKKAVIAKQITAMHKAGNRGPSASKKLTKKVRTWFAAKKGNRPVRQSTKAEDEALI